MISCSAARRALPTAGEAPRPATRQTEQAIPQPESFVDTPEQVEEIPSQAGLPPQEWTEAEADAANLPAVEAVPAATERREAAKNAARAHSQPAKAEEPPLTAAQQAKDAPRKLRLTLPTREPYMAQAKAVCEAHPGTVPAYLRIADEGITFLLDQAYWPDASAELQSALETLLGQQGISLI